MDVSAAQRDIVAAYINGAPGVFVSGMVWLIAGIAALSQNAEVAFAVLFLGGMLIVPGSLLIARIMFGADEISSDNPFQRLGLEATIVLFAGIVIAYALLRTEPELAFPALAIAIGARYFAFRTIYGEPTYWVLGGALTLIGTAAILRIVPLSFDLLLLVGGTECAFAVILLWRWRRRKGKGIEVKHRPL